MLKPDTLTTLGRLDYNLHTYLNNCHLTPFKFGQFAPVKDVQNTGLSRNAQHVYYQAPKFVIFDKFHFK